MKSVARSDHSQVTAPVMRLRTLTDHHTPDPG